MGASTKGSTSLISNSLDVNKPETANGKQPQSFSIYNPVNTPKLSPEEKITL